MPRRAPLGPVLVMVVIGAAGACSGPAPREREHRAATAAAISSAAATILDFTFDAEVIAPADVEARKAVVSQLMYTQGMLMSAGSGNAQIGNVELTSVSGSPIPGARRVAYHAVLPVAWSHEHGEPPEGYDLVLPRDVARLGEFNARYDGRCGHAAHGQDAFWFDYDPRADGCSLDETDIVRSRASVAPSGRSTADRYPEYDLVWSDGRLDVTAIFGVIEPGESEHGGHSSAFVNAHDFVGRVRQALTGATVTKNEPSSSILEDTTVSGKLSTRDHRDVEVNVLVVPKVSEAGPDFEARYGPLSERADLLLYNGHAGLGVEINAFGRAGRVPAGKYQLALLNGCQTFAYIDTTMTDRRREANDDDPSGTRYLDVVANALTSRTENFVATSDALFDAALHPERPRPYSELLDEIADGQIAVVFGEEDNRYRP